MALKPDGQGLTVVGDDAQSIYGFRAATVRNILDFPKQFQPPAAVVTLDRNYRSTKPILEAANAVMPLWRRSASPKTSGPIAAPAKSPHLCRCRMMRRKPDLSLSACSRTGKKASRSRNRPCSFAQAITAPCLRLAGPPNIPFVKFGGLKFLEAAHVKDLIAVLRWAENALDRMAGFRVLQLLPGIGPGLAGKLLDGLAAGPPFRFSLRSSRRRARPRMAGLRFAHAALWIKAAEWPCDIDLARNWLQPYVEQNYADALVRMGDLDQLAKIAASHASRAEFLTDLTLDPPQATSDELGKPLLDEDYLILSTIHSAKGQEWRSVSILNVVDGCIPSDLATGASDDIEEERRLLYVAMTRAKDELNLIVPQRFYTHRRGGAGDRHVYAGARASFRRA